MLFPAQTRDMPAQTPGFRSVVCTLDSARSTKSVELLWDKAPESPRGAEWNPADAATRIHAAKLEDCAGRATIPAAASRTSERARAAGWCVRASRRKPRAGGTAHAPIQCGQCRCWARASGALLSSRARLPGSAPGKTDCRAQGPRSRAWPSTPQPWPDRTCRDSVGGHGSGPAWQTTTVPPADPAHWLGSRILRATARDDLSL